MPRESRLVIPGVPVHITQRGNRRENIFRDDEDKAFYMKRFMTYKKLHRVKMYAWCLMDNHVHFVLEPKYKTSLYKLFLRLNTSYVRYFNKKYGIEGKLFGNRFFSCLLDEAHFVESIRYVELNPYRARMEKRLGKYTWSSLQERMGLRNDYFLSKMPDFYAVDNHLEFLFDAIDSSTKVLSAWEGIRSASRSGAAIGNENFLKKVIKELGDRKKLIELSFST